MLAGNTDLADWDEFDALSSSLFVPNPACREQRVRHARCAVCDNASIEVGNPEQIAG
jgi:hypothetical protein